MSKVVPHRRFISVELPFTLPASACQHGPQERDRRMIEAFLPPSFLAPCLDEAPEKAMGKKGSEKTPEGDGERQTTDDTPFVIASAAEYCHTEVFSGWRPLDFDADGSDLGDTSGDGSFRAVFGGASLTHTASEESRNERERMLRESFPSFVPQVLLHGFYRNDILLEVKRTRRVKRTRDAETGEVVKEIYLPEEGAPLTPVTRVVGVISREVNIARPADFSFAPFTPSQIETHPAQCSVNIFPPAHFVAEKSPFEVEYEISNAKMGAAALHGEGAQATMGEESEPTEWEFESMPTLTVFANNDNIPPPMLPAQESALKRLNLGGGDCVEVQITKSLLAERPVWIPQELLDAVLQSGFCPRTHINKKAMACLTYVIRNGPFNRLRVRLGFDPYASSATAPLQRLPVKMGRRSEIGTLLRDISRAPRIADAMRELSARRDFGKPSRSVKEEVLEEGGQQTPPYKPRGTFFEKLAKIIQGGHLFMAFQIIDISDEPFFSDLLSKVPFAEAMPLKKRTKPNGWIGEAGYHLASAHIVGTLLDMVKTEVAPILEMYGREGELERRGGHNGRSATPSAASPYTPPGSESAGDGGDEEEEGDDEEGSSGSSEGGSAASARAARNE